ncbi:RnfABCDGE type electron transport complex subunit D [Candidatus Gottesmanbacteria bacterium]|nr:RnfABCDGE type electron transport complex subunit D [Candidatus Gottesmanbacteria bacterium]
MDKNERNKNMMSAFRVLRIPKVQLAFLLFVIFLSAIVVNPLVKYGIGFALAVLLTASFDVLLTRIRVNVWFVPYAGVVTGMIIGLIMHPDLPWWGITLIAAIAILSKHFLRVRSGHMVNPAAAGLVLGGIILHQPVSWWAVSFQNVVQTDPFTLVAFVLLLLPLALSAVRLRRYGSIGSFLIAHTVLSVFPAIQTAWPPRSLLLTLTDPTLIFFATVMLPEPRTSPADMKRQIFYGITVALIAYVLGFPSIGQKLLSRGVLPDQLLIALLVGNVVF